MEIICNKCGAVIPKPDMKTIRDGEIEHTYFLCPDCGEAYRVSTTDKHLRKRIEDYNKMSARVKKGNCTKEFQKRVQKVKEDNVRRSRELAKAHPLDPFKALKDVNSTIRNTQTQLKDVQRLLKLDPSNTELLSQKQRLLKDAIGETKEKLETLKTAQEQAKKQLEEGTLGQDKYDALQREIEETEQSLSNCFFTGEIP